MSSGHILLVSVCPIINSFTIQLIIEAIHRKAPLYITILDLIHTDFWHTYRFTAIAISCIRFVAYVFGPVQATTALFMAMTCQFWGLATVIYLSVGVTVRYVHVYNKSMLLEDLTDNAFQNIIRAVVSVISAGSCLLLTLVFGGYPRFYHFLVDPENFEDFEIESNQMMIFYICLAIFLNITLRFLIYLAGKDIQDLHSQTDSGQDASKHSTGSIMLALIILVTPFLMTLWAFGPKADIVMFLSMLVVIPLLFVLLKKSLRINVIKILFPRLEVFSTNRVTPA